VNPLTTNASGRIPEALASPNQIKQSHGTTSAPDVKTMFDGEPLSTGAREELERIVSEHDRVAAAEVLEIAESLARWQIRQAAPLTVEERDQVHERMAELGVERRARVDAHRDRLARTARFLGSQVGRHLMTLRDAERRLEALISVTDPEIATPVYLVCRWEAVALVRAVFAKAVREGERDE
jgi:hypothetical protein